MNGGVNLRASQQLGKLGKIREKNISFYKITENTRKEYFVLQKSCRLFLLILKKTFTCLLATSGGMWDLSSLTRDRTRAACIGSAES